MMAVLLFNDDLLFFKHSCTDGTVSYFDSIVSNVVIKISCDLILAAIL